MSDKEKVDFKRKMAEVDVAGANDMQSWAFLVAT
jgi:hypothetical protein